MSRNPLNECAELRMSPYCKTQVKLIFNENCVSSWISSIWSPVVAQKLSLMAFIIVDWPSPFLLYCKWLKICPVNSFFKWALETDKDFCVRLFVMPRHWCSVGKKAWCDQELTYFTFHMYEAFPLPQDQKHFCCSKVFLHCSQFSF